MVDRIESGDAYIADALYGILKYPEDLSQAVEASGDKVSSLRSVPEKQKLQNNSCKGTHSAL